MQPPPYPLPIPPLKRSRSSLAQRNRSLCILRESDRHCRPTRPGPRFHYARFASTFCAAFSVVNCAHFLGTICDLSKYLPLGWLLLLTAFGLVFHVQLIAHFAKLCSSFSVRDFDVDGSDLHQCSVCPKFSDAGRESQPAASGPSGPRRKQRRSRRSSCIRFCTSSAWGGHDIGLTKTTSLGSINSVLLQ